LTRYRISQILIAHKLDSLGIPRSQLSGLRLYTLPAAQRLLAYLEASKDPRGINGDNFKKIINRPNRFIPNDLVEKFHEQMFPKKYFDQILKAFMEEETFNQELGAWKEECKKLEQNKKSQGNNEQKVPAKPKEPSSLKLAQEFATLKEGWHRKNLTNFFDVIEKLSKVYGRGLAVIFTFNCFWCSARLMP